MYHCVYKESTAESGFQNDSALTYKVREDKFEEHVKSISEYLEKNNLSKETVEFTFDDGGVSFYTIIAPILEKYGFKGVFFIATKYIDTPLFLTRAQVKELDEHGHIIASHSDSHPPRIDQLEYEDVKNEWEDSCNKLSGIIDHRVSIASVPNGNCSKKVSRAASDAGVTILYTSEPTTRTKEKYGVKHIGRYVVHSNTSTNVVLNIISKEKYRRKLSIRYGIIQFAHSLLGNNYNKVKMMFIHK